MHINIIHRKKNNVQTEDLVKITINLIDIRTHTHTLMK
jgi:hypothetical protein